MTPFKGGGTASDPFNICLKTKGITDLLRVAVAKDSSDVHFSYSCIDQRNCGHLWAKTHQHHHTSRTCCLVGEKQWYFMSIKWSSFLSEYSFGLYWATYINGRLDAALNTSAFNGNVRPSPKHVLHTLGQLLGFIATLNSQQEVCAHLFGNRQTLLRQIWAQRSEHKSHDVLRMWTLHWRLTLKWQVVLPDMTTREAPIALATIRETNPIGPVQRGEHAL